MLAKLHENRLKIARAINENYLHVGPSSTVGEGTDHKKRQKRFKSMLAQLLVRLWHIFVFFDQINMGVDTIFFVISDTV